MPRFFLAMCCFLFLGAGCAAPDTSAAGAEQGLLVFPGGAQLSWPPQPRELRLSSEGPTPGWYLLQGETEVFRTVPLVWTGAGLPAREPSRPLVNLFSTQVRLKCEVEGKLLDLQRVLGRREARFGWAGSNLSWPSRELQAGRNCDWLPAVDCLSVAFSAGVHVSTSRRSGVRWGANGHPLLNHSGSLDICLRPSVFVRTGDTEKSVDIQDGEIRFSPERVFSLLIFEAGFSNLAEAIQATAPVAVVPLPEDCGEADGKCLRSPLPLSSCEGCEKLVPGTPYAVFLVLGPGELNQDVKPVVIVGPPQAAN